MSFQIPDGDSLVDFLKDFTGSTNTAEIKQCIYLAELSMRNIELPALRSDPYAIENIGVADSQGRIPIPLDMNKPILFFKQGNQYSTSATATGTIGQYTIDLTSTPSQSLQVGMIVAGSGIASGASIASFNSTTNIVLDLPNTGTVSGTLTFSTVASTSGATGPWIVYDRIGDRDIITQGMIAQLYLSPVNVPAVIRGKFSEVYDQYQFLPWIGAGAQVNMYYYKAWPLLFSPIDDEIVSATGTIGTIAGAGPWTAQITGMSDTVGLEAGSIITATAGTGSIGTGGVYVVTSTTSTSVNYTATGGTTPIAGTVTNVALLENTGRVVETNAVLQTWSEGYVYSTLREYYIKRHNPEDAAIYQQKYTDAWNIVNDQNNLGKWSGGHTRLTSVWQPRQYRNYSLK